ncbi:MAG: ABC transporter substrate binding protein [Rhodocyclaceae bacterium]|nr:ABC transporter substrate binding protein [Rhodocyclaceae bacterium]
MAASRRSAGAAWRRVAAGWRMLLCCVIGLTVVAAAAALQPGRGIAVIYPDIGEPYRSVFAKIIEGIEEQARSRVPSFAVGANPNTQDIAAELRRQDIRVVIALGRNGLKLTSGLERDIGVVAGGVLSIPEADARNIAVHSLAPDPALLFARLQAFMPTAKRVFVVYDPNQNAWLVRLAREAASARGLELVGYEAPDLKAAMRIYQDIFASADPKRDALWLLQDSTTVDETSVLPLVLQETWSRNLTFFSSSVAHVRRGALFSLYPNNVEIGRHLANSALGYLSSGGQIARGVTPLKAVLLAVNVRTAGHLGINLSSRQHFDLVFPEQ